MLNNYSNLQKQLNDFINAVIISAKDNLQRSDKIASGSLSNSMYNSGIKIMPNSLEIGLIQNDYGAFIDKGVSGTQKRYDTIYSYKDKMPPVKAIDKWLYDRGIAPRNKKGQFVKRMSTAFAIAKNIQKYGIEPSHYLSDAVQENKAILPEELRSAFALDVQGMVDFIIRTNKKRK